jgi:hypothetical protein
MMGSVPRKPYRRHQVSVTSLISPNFLKQIKTRYEDGIKDQSAYVFKTVKKVIVRPGGGNQFRSYKSKSTYASSVLENARSGQGNFLGNTIIGGTASLFEDSLMMTTGEQHTQFNNSLLGNPFDSQR